MSQMVAFWYKRWFSSRNQDIDLNCISSRHKRMHGGGSWNSVCAVICPLLILSSPRERSVWNCRLNRWWDEPNSMSRPTRSALPNHFDIIHRLPASSISADKSRGSFGRTFWRLGRIQSLLKWGLSTSYGLVASHLVLVPTVVNQTEMMRFVSWLNCAVSKMVNNSSSTLICSKLQSSSNTCTCWCTS